MNKPDSERFKQIDRENLNKPLAHLRCPRCESARIERDVEDEHPGVFWCRDCDFCLLA